MPTSLYGPYSDSECGRYWIRVDRVESLYVAIDLLPGWWKIAKRCVLQPEILVSAEHNDVLDVEPLEYAFTENSPKQCLFHDVFLIELIFCVFLSRAAGIAGRLTGTQGLEAPSFRSSELFVVRGRFPGSS